MNTFKVTAEMVNAARHEWDAAKQKVVYRTLNTTEVEAIALKQEEDRLYNIWYNLHIDFIAQNTRNW